MIAFLKIHQGDEETMDDSSGETIARCQMLFEECQEAIAILTREGQVLDVNQARLDLFGYEHKEISGLDAARASLVQSGYLIVSKATWSDAARSKTTPYSSAGKTGTDRLPCHRLRLARKGGRRGYIAVVRDVTVQKEMERSLRSLLRMSETLNSASDLDSLLDALVEQLLELTGVRAVVLVCAHRKGCRAATFFKDLELYR